MKKRLVQLFLIMQCLILLFACAGDPEVTIPDQTVDEGTQLLLELKRFVKDSRNAPHTFELISGVGAVDTDSGQFSFSPNFGDHGTYDTVMRVTNNKGRSTDHTFKITVNRVNRAPVVSIPDQTVESNETLRLDLSNYASDPDGDQMSFRLLDGKGTLDTETAIFELYITS